MTKIKQIKRYEFAIDEYQTNWVFSPIRGRRDIISLLMKTVKIMLVNSRPDEKSIAGKVVLVISKMSRLFYVSDMKVFSISFPFFVQEADGNFTFKSQCHSNVNSKVSSDILSLLEAEAIFETSEVFNFAEPIFDACEYDLELWALFRDLLMGEDGYIRYDHDTEREKGHRHPINHLDVFYTTSSTFKLGLNDRIDHDYIADILNTNTDCHYVMEAGK